jgi:hypothetical protein
MNNHLPLPDDIIINHITPHLTARALKTLRLSCKTYAHNSELKTLQMPVDFKTVIGAREIFLYEVDRLFVSGNHFKKAHQSNQKRYFSRFTKHYVEYFSQIDLKELGLALDEGIASIVENGQAQETNVMILTTKNRIMAFGDNAKGQLGFNHDFKIKRMRQVPVVLNGKEKIIQLEMGYDFSVLMTSSNRILLTGQFGSTRSKQFNQIPVKLDDKETIQNIFIRGNVIFLTTSKSRLLRADAERQHWNTMFNVPEVNFKPVYFGLGRGESLKDIQCLPGLNIAVSTSGKIYFSGDRHSEFKEAVSNILQDDLRVKKIAVNQEHTYMPFILLLLNNNQLYSYGNNRFGQLGWEAEEILTPLRKVQLYTGMDNISYLSCRYNMSIISTQQGRLLASGYNHGNRAFNNHRLSQLEKFTEIFSRQPNQLNLKELRIAYLHILFGFSINFIQEMTLGTKSYKGALLLGIAGGLIQYFVDCIIEKWCVEKLEKESKASLYF